MKCVVTVRIPEVTFELEYDQDVEQDDIAYAVVEVFSRGDIPVKYTKELQE